jgi:hypothetical protein
MAQQNKVYFETNIGRAQYPWLNSPDSAFGGEPKYKTNLVLEDHLDLLKLIQGCARAEFGEKADGARMPFDLDEDTGEMIIKVKSKYAPAFFDATGEEIFGGQIPNLWAGSKIRIGGYASPYSVSGSNGVSLQLTKVQIVLPVTGGSKTQSGGFDSVEGGFKAQDPVADEEVELDEVQQEAATSADRF